MQYTQENRASAALNGNTIFRQSLAGESPSVWEDCATLHVPQDETELLMSPIKFIRPSFSLQTWSQHITTKEFCQVWTDLFGNEYTEEDFEYELPPHPELQSGRKPCSCEDCKNDPEYAKDMIDLEDFYDPPSEDFVTASAVTTSSSSSSEPDVPPYDPQTEVYGTPKPRSSKPRRLPRSEYRKEQEYHTKVKDLPSNDNVRSAWARFLRPNDKLRPYTPYGPRIYRTFELDKRQETRLRILFPHVCTGDFDIEIMVLGFQAFCKKLYELQWYRVGDQFRGEAMKLDILRKLKLAVQGYQLQRLDGKQRTPKIVRKSALLFWMSNYKFLLRCFSPQRDDIFSTRWAFFYKDAKSYYNLTSSVKPTDILLQAGWWDKVSSWFTTIDDSKVDKTCSISETLTSSVKEAGSEIVANALRSTLSSLPGLVLQKLKDAMSLTRETLSSFFSATIGAIKSIIEKAMNIVSLLFESVKADPTILTKITLGIVMVLVMALLYKYLDDELYRALFITLCVALMAAFGCVATLDSYQRYQQMFTFSGEAELQSGTTIASIFAFVASFFTLRDMNSTMNIVNHFGDFASNLKDGFEWLINTIYRFCTGTHYYPSFKKKEELQKHLDDLRKFFDTPQLQLLIQHQPNAGAVACALNVRSRELLPTLSTLFKHNSPAYQEIFRAFEQIKNLAAEAESNSVKTKDRITPFVIWFSGPPGGGKSESAALLPEAIYNNVRAKLPNNYLFDWTDSMNYFKADTSDFWSMYEAHAHFCCTIEEYNAQADQVTRGKQTAEFLKLVSGSIMPLDQPFQNKGKSFFGSELIIVTTNISEGELMKGSGSTDPNALFRRRHLHVQARKHKNFPNKTDRTRNRNEAWRYQLQADNSLAMDWNPKLFAKASSVGVDFNFDDIVHQASTEIVRRILERDANRGYKNNVDWTNLKPSYSPSSSSSSSSSDDVPPPPSSDSDSDPPSDEDREWIDERTEGRPGFKYSHLVHTYSSPRVSEMMDRLRHHEWYPAFNWTPKQAIFPEEQEEIDRIKKELYAALPRKKNIYYFYRSVIEKFVQDGYNVGLLGQYLPPALLRCVREGLFQIFLTEDLPHILASPSYDILHPPPKQEVLLTECFDSPTGIALEEDYPNPHPDLPLIVGDEEGAEIQLQVGDQPESKYQARLDEHFAQHNSSILMEDARITMIRQCTKDNFPYNIEDQTSRTWGSIFTSWKPNSKVYDYMALGHYLNVFETDMVLSNSPLSTEFFTECGVADPTLLTRHPKLCAIYSADRKERRDAFIYLFYWVLNVRAYQFDKKAFLDDTPKRLKVVQFATDLKVLEKIRTWRLHPVLYYSLNEASAFNGKRLTPCEPMKGSEAYLWYKFFAHIIDDKPIRDLKDPPPLYKKKELLELLTEFTDAFNYRASILSSILNDFESWLEADAVAAYVFSATISVVCFTLGFLASYYGVLALISWSANQKIDPADLQSLSKGQLARLNKVHKLRFQARKKTGQRKTKVLLEKDGTTSHKKKYYKAEIDEFEKLPEKKQTQLQSSLQQTIAAKINKIGNNIYDFTFIYENGPQSTYGLVSNRRVFITAHFFEMYGYNFKEMIMNGGSSESKRIQFDRLIVTRIPGRDLTAIDLPMTVNSVRALRFATKQELKNFSIDRYQVARVHRTAKKGVVNIQVVTGNNLKPGTVFDEHCVTAEGKKIRWKIDDFLVCVGSQGERGDCSLPYIACDRTDGSVFVLGTHFARLGEDSFVSPIFDTDQNHSVAYTSGVALQCASKGAWFPPCVENTLPTRRKDFDGRLRSLGQVEVPSYIPSETNIIPSPFQGSDDFPPIEPITCFPALLKPTIFEDDETQTLVRPLHNALEKLVSPPVVPFPTNLLEFAEQHPEKAYAGFTPTIRKEFRQLTLEEALEHLSRDTAIGHDMKVLGFKSRKEMWTVDESTGKVNWVHPKVRAAVQKVLDAMDAGYEPRNTVTGCLKDEPRPEARVRAGKTRLFCVGSFAHLCATIMVMGDIVTFMKAHLGTSDVAIGVNPHGNEWTEIIRKLLKFGNLGGGDFSNYDTSIVSEFGYLLYRCLSRYTNWFISNPLWNWRLYCVCMSAVSPIMIIGDEAYLLDWMNSSGGWLTGFINSFVNVVVFNFYFETVCQENQLDLIREEHLAAWFYGDDNIWSVSDVVAPFFTMKRLGDFILKNFGMTYTTAEKTEIKDDFCSLSSLEFLCRRFVKWDKDSELYHAQLSQDSISQMLLWLRAPKKGVSVAEQMSINVEQAMMEYYHYGPEVFAEKQQKLYSYSVRFGVPWKAQTFEQYHRRFADGILSC
jgi:hypothetical protein